MSRAGRLAAGIALSALAVAPLPARAVQPGEMLKDPALESRARTLSEGLRCLVCQNQSIDDSNADLARDIRLLVRERLKQGDSDTQIRDFLVQRYGAFILLKPPFEPGTLLLWGMPVLVLVLGGVAVLLATRRARGSDPAAPLSEAERRRLEELVGGQDRPPLKVTNLS
jgi:cytochrome c-type biogenesis protein CcmH